MMGLVKAGRGPATAMVADVVADATDKHIDADHH